jgi:hypothetical protein
MVKFLLVVTDSGQIKLSQLPDKKPFLTVWDLVWGFVIAFIVGSQMV